jgi:predicted glycosyltransferase involved in capsule biosynthesis
VVTYHKRFNEFLVPLIKSLTSIFSDVEILVIVNGHPDRTLQINYLDKITTLLKQFPKVRYLTYDQHQSLSKCWNQLIILSHTEKIIIMNDDTQVTELFRQELENKVIQKNFSTINTSWSHFLISKNIIRTYGWFDERYIGVGFEDADYAYRMIIANFNNGNIINTDCLGLRNYVADQPDPGWKNLSKRNTANKYTSANHEFAVEKWHIRDFENSSQQYKYKFMWDGKITTEFTPKGNPTPPMFYDLSVLETKGNSVMSSKKTSPIKQVFISTQRAWFSLRYILKKIYFLLR